jgi:uncharacterized protein
MAVVREVRSKAWRWSALIVAMVALVSSTSAHAATTPANGPWNAEPASFGVSQPTQYMVTMSDGVQLAADVYRPTLASGADAPGPFPVILSQTPYGKRSVLTTQSMGQGMGGDGYYPYLIERGYIDVVADVRGTGSSGGDFSLYGPREQQDGVELARWAARLPGSTGKVGLAGSSYLALNQLFTAALVGPRSPIKAIMPAAVGNDIYRDIAFGGGIPNTEFAVVWEGLRSSMVAQPPDEPQQDPTALLQHPIQRAQTLAEFDGGLYSDVDTGGPDAFDGSFWQQRSPSAFLDRIVSNGIPALLVSGWHDVYQRGAVLDYAGLQSAWSRLHHGPGKPAIDVPPMTAKQKPTPRYQLVVGPWFHNPITLGLTYQEMQLAWFDHWLKGARNGIAATNNPLHSYELGANRWVNVARWPLTITRARTYYLDQGGLASKPAQANDKLIWADIRSPCNAGTDQWSTGLPAYAIAEAGGTGDPCAENDSTTQLGGVTYTSEPFTTATTVAGPIDVTLYATSTTPDAELLASVDVVSPNGTSLPISSGALLGSLRATDPQLSWRENGHLILPWHPYTAASARPMQPNQTERLDIEVYPTMARIAPGDKLRLTLTAGDTALQPSPVQATKLAGGTYEIERGSITLPMLPAANLKTSSIDWGGCNGSC